MADDFTSPEHCALCDRLDPTQDLIRCTSCKLRYHAVTCLHQHGALPLDWLSGVCDGIGPNPRTVLDITLDTDVHYFLRQGTYPNGKTEKEKTRIRKRACRFDFQDTQLCRKADAAHGIRVVPAIEDCMPLTKQGHEAAGHFGLKHVRHFLQRKYYWNNITHTITTVLAECEACQLVNREQLIASWENHPIPVLALFHRWHIDLMGPFAKSGGGNLYTIVAVEAARKWVEAGALPDKTALTVKEWVWRELICRYGCPHEIVTDNGNEFEGEFRYLMDECHIDHHHTSSHHPRANGAVEKLNYTIQFGLAKVVNSHRNDWDLRLPQLLLAIRSTRHESVRMEPSVAHMGKPLMLPGFAALKLQLPDPEPESSTANEAATKQRQTALEEIGKSVLRNVAQAQAIQSAKYSAAHKRARDAGTASSLRSETLRAPIVGDYVHIRNLKKGKLQPAWESSIYHLVEYNHDETVATLEMTDGTRWTENVEHLKVYRGPSPAGF
ncbi:hypothetical protein WJX75_002853 [Coccomyxa subellipsoidea]|uniref:Integrase catalytic domain-containing protein n=1 Tax=Coccomyxa subellipsoidea TaxID=248742 RepID=A0ABR2Z2F9_9CHLO